MLLMLKCLVIVIRGKCYGHHDDNLIIIRGKCCNCHDNWGIVIIMNELIPKPKTPVEDPKSIRVTISLLYVPYKILERHIQTHVEQIINS